MDHAEEQAQELEALEAILMDDLQGDVASCRRTHTACALPTAPPPPPGVRAPPHWSLYPLAMLMQSSRERGPTAGILRAPATASLSPPRTTAPPAQTRTISPVRVRVGVRRSVFALWPTRPCLRLIVALWPTPTERLFHWPQRDCANWHSRPRGCIAALSVVRSVGCRAPRGLLWWSRPCQRSRDTTGKGR